jgi:hypothetical protein
MIRTRVGKMRPERCFLLVCRDLDHSGELALGFSDPYAPIPDLPALAPEMNKPRTNIAMRPLYMNTKLILTSAYSQEIVDALDQRFSSLHS